ncbi:ligand-binding protein SH3 [Patescibacteria group bacterium]|nr:MAG: ligand-binding protein SH3 [Patescibacteria group bacterium]
MIPAWIQVMCIAMLPVIETRGALPLGILAYKLPTFVAFAASVIGNLVPVPFIYLTLPIALRSLERVSPRFHAFMQTYFHAVKEKHRKSFETASAVAIFVFVVAPFPGTGMWTATLLSVLFGIPFAVAFPAIALGVLVSALAILAVTTGGIALF